MRQALSKNTHPLNEPKYNSDIDMVDNIHLYNETSGAGNIPVILVHGYGMSSVVWEKVMPLFGSDYRLFALDLPGFGRSDKPATGYSCSELADRIGKFMDMLGLTKAVLIGHSFGSLVIQHFAACYPQRVLALVLSNAFAAALPPKGLNPSVEERINGYGTPEQSRKIFSAVIPRYFDAANVTGQDIERFIEIGLQADNTALRETLKANYTTPAIPADRHTALLAPVLILVATHDPFGTFDQAVSMSDAWPNSHIAVITRSGHSPMWEKPAEFVRIVEGFLKHSVA